MLTVQCILPNVCACSPSPEVLAVEMPLIVSRSYHASSKTTSFLSRISDPLYLHIMSLCEACRAIDPKFFSPQFDNAELMQGPEVAHLPINWIRRSARDGCPLCICLIASASVDWLPETLLETRRVILRRATIDPHMALAMCVDLNDVSHTYFFRIPSGWENLPRAELGRPCRDVDIMNLWVQKCITTHPACSSIDRSFVPTRLLDVQAFRKSKDIKLVTPKGKCETVDYLALSHCWGPPSERPLTTTKSTLDQRLQRISFYDLSLTFKDAVKLTSDLGQRYLWIDSLCIVQDDHEDWVREASQMAAVYGNALLALSALSSENSTMGCRVRNQRTAANDRRFFDFGSGPNRVRIFEGDFTKWDEEYGDDTYRRGAYGENPLRGRAWTLQERELSTRNIHFSSNVVLWECGMVKGSTDLPWLDPQPMDDFLPWAMKHYPGESLEAGGSLSTRDRWYRLMEDYMSRQLTKGTDKLPALSGLAQSFRNAIPSGQYLAGIWSEHLPHSLLWRMKPNRDAQRSKEYRAPTWSFLSLDGIMSYESQMVDNDGGDRVEDIPSGFACEGLLEVLDFQIAPSGADVYGNVNAASISLRGSLLKVEFRSQSSSDKEDDAWHTVYTLEGSIAGLCFLDIVDEPVVGVRAWCVGVRPEPGCSLTQKPHAFTESDDSVGPSVMGLALQEEMGSAHTFRRLGLVRWMKRSCFDSIAVSDFVLL